MSQTRANVLLVDNDPKNLTVLETILDSPDFHLVKAQSGQEALMAVLNHEFAVIVLDVHMPGMSGLEFAQIIRQRQKTRHIPIVFLTAYFQDDKHAIEGYSAGAVDYLHKPVNPFILRSKVRVFVELARAVALRSELAARQQAEASMTAALREKETLLKDLHQRANDSLQIVSRLLELQGACLQQPEALRAFAESAARVQAMALVHKRTERDANLSSVELSDCLRELTSWLLQGRQADPQRITLRLELARITLGLDAALACALVVNELVSNALGHAYPGGRGGEILVRLRLDEQRVRLEVADNGKGLPAGADWTKGKSFGLSLVRVLVRELQGQVYVTSERGMHFSIVFPQGQAQKLTLQSL